jgi:3-isopropylmalate/(R)-2-methylmalate dehydratase small subunit
MKAVRVISGRGVPLRRSDVDTDQIIPASGSSAWSAPASRRGLFATWRDDRNFVLNDERYAGASILVAGPAVRGRLLARARRSGRSSRGASTRSSLRASATSSATTAARTGLPPVTLPEPTVVRCGRRSRRDPSTQIVVDIERCWSRCRAQVWSSVPMDP